MPRGVRHPGHRSSSAPEGASGSVRGLRGRRERGDELVESVGQRQRGGRRDGGDELGADDLGDLILSYHDTQEEADAFLQSAPIQAIPAVARGQVAQVVGTELIAAVSPPTALSLTYGLDELVASLSAAAGMAWIGADWRNASASSCVSW